MEYLPSFPRTEYGRDYVEKPTREQVKKVYVKFVGDYLGVYQDPIFGRIGGLQLPWSKASA